MKHVALIDHKMYSKDNNSGKINTQKITNKIQHPRTANFTPQWVTLTFDLAFR